MDMAGSPMSSPMSALSSQFANAGGLMAAAGQPIIAQAQQPQPQQQPPATAMAAGGGAHTPAPTAVPTPFGVVVEGYPPATSFAQVEETRFVLTEAVPYGQRVRRLTFFLTQVPAPIPDGMVASVYASMYPHREWRFLGSVSNAEPSRVMAIHWPEKDIADQPAEAPCQIGVTVEAGVAAAAGGVEAQIAQQEAFGKAIGMDLFNFMESFNHGVGTAIFEKWFEKLQWKLRHKPEQWAQYRNAA